MDTAKNDTKFWYPNFGFVNRYSDFFSSNDYCYCDIINNDKDYYIANKGMLAKGKMGPNKCIVSQVTRNASSENVLDRSTVER